MVVGLVFVLAGILVQRTNEFSITVLLDSEFDDILNGFSLWIGEVLESIKGNRVTIDSRFTVSWFRDGEGVDELVVDDHFCL